LSLQIEIYPHDYQYTICFGPARSPIKQSPLIQGLRRTRVKHGEGAREVLGRSPHAKSCADHRTWVRPNSITIVHITNGLLRRHHTLWGTVSAFSAYIKVIRRHPQGTLHLYHFLHITTSFGYWLERWSANMFANTFLLHREYSTFAALEHREQPFLFLDCHRTYHYYIIYLIIYNLITIYLQLFFFCLLKKPIFFYQK